MNEMQTIKTKKKKNKIKSNKWVSKHKNKNNKQTNF